MLKRIKNLSVDKKRLLSNYFSLSMLQAVNFILPLIALPYLFRVLDADKFGLVMFAQAFIVYFVLLVDFGFNLSATREISIHRENKKKVEEIFNAVMTIKIILLFFAFIIFLILVYSFDRFYVEKEVFLLTFGIVIGQALFPVWFFHGIEKMKYVTIINIIAKVIFTGAIFIFIHSQDDYLIAPILQSLGFIVAGLLSLWIVHKDFKMMYHIPNKKVLLSTLKDSSHFFLSRLSLSVYTTSNAFILGLFTNNAIVGYYVIAEKLYIAMQQLYQPISTALYPYVAKEKNISLFKKVFIIANTLNLFAVILIWFFSDNIINMMFGNNLESSIIVFKILLFAAVVTVPSIMLGYPFLAALGYKNYANYSVVAGSIFHLLGLLILILIEQVNIYAIAILLFFTETLVLSIRMYGVKINNLWGVKYA